VSGTDSAVLLLSGVHRRDVRELTRSATEAGPALTLPLGLAAQVVARWMNQAIFVDELTAESAEHLPGVSRQAWQQAFKLVMAQAQERFDIDQQQAAPEQRRHHARFGFTFSAGVRIEWPSRQTPALRARTPDFGYHGHLLCQPR